MIRFNLDNILKNHKISRTKFANMANVRPNTINDMCNGNTRRIEVETLNNIMNTINKIDNNPVDISDLISFEKDE